MSEEGKPEAGEVIEWTMPGAISFRLHVETWDGFGPHHQRPAKRVDLAAAGFVPDSSLTAAEERATKAEEALALHDNAAERQMLFELTTERDGLREQLTAASLLASELRERAEVAEAALKTCTEKLTEVGRELGKAEGERLLAAGRLTLELSAKVVDLADKLVAERARAAELKAEVGQLKEDISDWRRSRGELLEEATREYGKLLNQLASERAGREHLERAAELLRDSADVIFTVETKQSFRDAVNTWYRADRAATPAPPSEAQGSLRSLAVSMASHIAAIDTSSSAVADYIERTLSAHVVMKSSLGDDNAPAATAAEGERVPCSECGGSGEGPDRCDGPGDVYQGKCPRCDGKGLEPPPASPPASLGVCAYESCLNQPLPGSRRCYDHQPQRCPEPPASGADGELRVGQRVKWRHSSVWQPFVTITSLPKEGRTGADVLHDDGCFGIADIRDLEASPPPSALGPVELMIAALRNTAGGYAGAVPTYFNALANELARMQKGER